MFIVVVVYCCCLLQGKLTGRERVQLLLDDESFIEYDSFMEHTCTVIPPTVSSREFYFPSDVIMAAK